MNYFRFPRHVHEALKADGCTPVQSITHCLEARERNPRALSVVKQAHAHEQERRRQETSKTST